MFATACFDGLIKVWTLENFTPQYELYKELPERRDEHRTLGETMRFGLIGQYQQRQAASAPSLLSLAAASDPVALSSSAFVAPAAGLDRPSAATPEPLATRGRLEEGLRESADSVEAVRPSIRVRRGETDGTHSTGPGKYDSWCSFRIPSCWQPRAWRA